ncbi:MAG: septum formation initiator family protein [Balneolales bacterium]|nr:septum formation initiator family protein [Balneolales bacterium]
MALLGAFVFVWFAFIDVYSLKTRWELHQQKDKLHSKTMELAAQSELLEIKLESLENDPTLLEKIAREEYGMRKPGETVYKITVKE